MRGAPAFALSLSLSMTAAFLGCRQGDGGTDPSVQGASQQDRYRRPERLLAALGVRAGERVADVGAGGGYLTLHLARAVGPSGRVVATDIDQEALALLRRRAAGLPWVETRRADAAAERGGLEEGSHDLVLLAQVDHLLPEERRGAALLGLLQALRPGGRLALANAERHRDGTERALRAAGLWGRAREVQAGLPGQFLILVQ